MKNIRDFHDKLSNIFHLTLAPPLLAMGYLFLETNHRGWMPSMIGNSLVIAACFIASILLAAFAYVTYRKRVLEIRGNTRVAEGFRLIFPVYRNFYLANLAVALLLTLGYYLTGANLLLGSYVTLLFLLSFLRPYSDRYIGDLQLGEEESKAVRKKELNFQ